MMREVHSGGRRHLQPQSSGGGVSASDAEGTVQRIERSANRRGPLPAVSFDSCQCILLALSVPLLSSLASPCGATAAWKPASERAAQWSEEGDACRFRFSGPMSASN